MSANFLRIHFQNWNCWIRNLTHCEVLRCTQPHFLLSQKQRVMTLTPFLSPLLSLLDFFYSSLGSLSIILPMMPSVFLYWLKGPLSMQSLLDLSGELVPGPLQTSKYTDAQVFSTKQHSICIKVMYTLFYTSNHCLQIT